MTEVCHTTDLSALAAWLRPTGRHQRLVGLIDKAAAAATIRQDLLEAERCLAEIDQQQAARENGDKAVSEREVTVIGALFSHAVVLYARATFTSSKQRKGILADDYLTPELRAAHRAIKTLRNSDIAHYGRGEHLSDGPLVREAVLFTFWRGSDRVREQMNVLSTRAAHKVGVQRQLRDLLRAQLDRLAASEQDILDAVRDELERAVRSDDQLGHTLPRFPFDAYAFCATADAAFRLAIGLQQGVFDEHSYAADLPSS